jgi:DNA primase
MALPQILGQVERMQACQKTNEYLLNNIDAKDALDYLIEERKLTIEAIKKYKLGYCYEGFEDYRLAGKIIHPIYDVYDELIAISTRRLKSKEFWHESFDKSMHLYGLNLVKNNIIKKQSAIVVEGEFDAIYMNSVGIDNVVSCMGTAFSITQFIILSRYCNNIYLCFDGDEAGKKAVDRVKVFLRDKLGFSSKYKFRDFNVKNISIPNNKDPDDFIKENGTDAFYELVNFSKNLV